MEVVADDIGKRVRALETTECEEDDVVPSSRSEKRPARPEEALAPNCELASVSSAEVRERARLRCWHCGRTRLVSEAGFSDAPVEATRWALSLIHI